MTNEELMRLLSEGDESALDKLCENNRGKFQELILSFVLVLLPQVG